MDLTKRIEDLQGNYVPYAAVLERRFLKRTLGVAWNNCERKWKELTTEPLPPATLDWNQEPSERLYFPWQDTTLHLERTFKYEDSSNYYAIMRMAGECKDPFCDVECPIQLDVLHDVPMLKIVLTGENGPVIAQMVVWCPLPDRIERHLRDKGLIRKHHYSSSQSAGVTTQIVCPTS
jgi:hypothetical protein